MTCVRDSSTAGKSSGGTSCKALRKDSASRRKPSSFAAFSMPSCSTASKASLWKRSSSARALCNARRLRSARKLSSSASVCSRAAFSSASFSSLSPASFSAFGAVPLLVCHLKLLEPPILPRSTMPNMTAIAMVIGTLQGICHDRTGLIQASLAACFCDGAFGCCLLRLLPDRSARRACTCPGAAEHGPVSSRPRSRFKTCLPLANRPDPWEATASRNSSSGSEVPTAASATGRREAFLPTRPLAANVSDTSPLVLLESTPMPRRPSGANERCALVHQRVIVCTHLAEMLFPEGSDLTVVAANADSPFGAATETLL
mmetsp:Transcript_32026/g.101931  ORF Transcript_32026/g.101931 Transcript_32026/m.101931 type:complete len:316 (-) Transcript_32026:176-1123(-)